MNNYTVLCTEKFSVTTLESTRMKRSFRLSVKDAPLTNRANGVCKQTEQGNPLSRDFCIGWSLKSLLNILKVLAHLV